MMRLVWLILGFVSLALGTIGAFLPLLPTVPFLLLSAFLFARSSDRLHGWLVNHRLFGPSIRAWQARGAIGRKAKVSASASIILAFALSWALGVRLGILVIQAVVLLAVAVFIWTRPES